MPAKEIFTNLHSRLRLIKNNSASDLNWIFLPGGPGLGSESLDPLTSLLELPGTMWYLDLPGDGSNHTQDDANSFSHWSNALVEAVDQFDQSVLVAHSTGGMYALATPELEDKLTGLVLMSSAPDASWQKLFSEVLEANPVPEMLDLHQQYVNNPSNELLKELTLASIPYLFTKQGLGKDISFLKTLPYNYKTCDWSAEHFDQTYSAKWVPQHIPTLIFSGDHDYVTFDLFGNARQFHCNNILIKKIHHAAHFPWIENPKEVIQVFDEFARNLINSKDAS